LHAQIAAQCREFRGGDGQISVRAVDSILRFSPLRFVTMAAKEKRRKSVLATDQVAIRRPKLF
jgi:hypothetical protein